MYCMLWFNFIPGLSFRFFSFKLIFVHYHTQKQKKIKFKPRIKLNHNIYITKKKKTIWKKEKSNTRKLTKKFRAPREDQTHDPPSSSLDALTNNLLEALWPAESKLNHL